MSSAAATVVARRAGQYKASGLDAGCARREAVSAANRRDWRARMLAQRRAARAPPQLAAALLAAAPAPSSRHAPRTLGAAAPVAAAAAAAETIQAAATRLGTALEAADPAELPAAASALTQLLDAATSAPDTVAALEVLGTELVVLLEAVTCQLLKADQTVKVGLDLLLAVAGSCRSLTAGLRCSTPVLSALLPPPSSHHLLAVAALGAHVSSSGAGLEPWLHALPLADVLRALGSAVEAANRLDHAAPERWSLLQAAAGTCVWGPPCPPPPPASPALQHVPAPVPVPVPVPVPADAALEWAMLARGWTAAVARQAARAPHSNDFALDSAQRLLACPDEAVAAAGVALLEALLAAVNAANIQAASVLLTATGFIIDALPEAAAAIGGSPERVGALVTTAAAAVQQEEGAATLAPGMEVLGMAALKVLGSSVSHSSVPDTTQALLDMPGGLMTIQRAALYPAVVNGTRSTVQQEAWYLLSNAITEPPPLGPRVVEVVFASGFLPEIAAELRGGSAAVQQEIGIAWVQAVHELAEHQGAGAVAPLLDAELLGALAAALTAPGVRPLLWELLVEALQALLRSASSKQLRGILAALRDAGIWAAIEARCLLPGGSPNLAVGLQQVLAWGDDWAEGDGDEPPASEVEGGLPLGEGCGSGVEPAFACLDELFGSGGSAAGGQRELGYGDGGWGSMVAAGSGTEDGVPASDCYM